MGTMALASGGRSTLNPNAPLFIPAALQQVEDFSPQWWELVKTSKWFHDYWVRQHEEQESFDGNDEDEDIANLLPESFDLGIEEEFLNLLIDPTLSAEAEEPITDMPQEERPHSGSKSVTEAMIKSLSLKSPKGGVQSQAETWKYWEKPAQHVSPRYASRRIHQPR